MKRSETLIEIEDYGSESVVTAAKMADAAAAEFNLRHRDSASLVGFIKRSDGSRKIVYRVTHDDVGIRRGVISVGSPS